MASTDNQTAATMEHAEVKTGEWYRRNFPVLLDSSQGGEVLNADPRTVTRMCNDGQIKAVKVRGTWRINRDALLSFCGLV